VCHLIIPLNVICWNWFLAAKYLSNHAVLDWIWLADDTKIFSSETTGPNETKNCRNDVCKVVCKASSFCLNLWKKIWPPWTNLGSDWLWFLKSSLRLQDQLEPNFAGMVILKFSTLNLKPYWFFKVKGQGYRVKFLGKGIHQLCVALVINKIIKWQNISSAAQNSDPVYWVAFKRKGTLYNIHVWSSSSEWVIVV
jgi:hypothetical protein